MSIEWAALFFLSLSIGNPPPQLTAPKAPTVSPKRDSTTVTVVSEVGRAACEARRAKADYQLQLRSVSGTKLIATLAEVTCFTFEMEPLVPGAVTLHPSDDEAVPAWKPEQVFSAVVSSLMKQGAVFVADGPGRYRVGAPGPCVQAEREARFKRSLKRIAASHFEVPLTEVLSIGQDFLCASGKLRLVPAGQNEKAHFRLYNVAPESIAAALGLRSGDVLVTLQVDGVELTTWEQPAVGSTLTMNLEREGKPVRVDVRLSW